MPRLDADFIRKNLPGFTDASDVEVAQFVHEALAPGSDYREFEAQFLGEPSFWKETRRGINRGARTLRATANLLAGAAAPLLDFLPRGPLPAGAAAPLFDFLSRGRAPRGADEAPPDRYFRAVDDDLAAIRRLAPRRSFGSVEDAGDLALWAGGVGGEFLPSLLLGGVGGKVAGSMTRGLSAAASDSARNVATATLLGSPALLNARQRAEYLMGPRSENTIPAAVAIAATSGALGSLAPTRALAAPWAGLGITRTIKDVGRHAAFGTGIGALTPLGERAAAGIVAEFAKRNEAEGEPLASAELQKYDQALHDWLYFSNQERAARSN